MIPLLLAAALIPPPAARLPPVQGPPASDGDAEPKSTPPSANAASQALLSRLGWKAIENDALVRLAGAQKGYIPGNYLSEAGIEWKDGDLNFEGGDAIPENLLPMILEGLWIFVQAAQTPAAEAGKALAAWGLPPVIDGRKLMDPDGCATYYGQMLRFIYAERPDALKRAGAERLSQALDLLLHAREQAFGTASGDGRKPQAPDIAKTDVDRARLVLLAPVRAGETPFGVTPYEDLGGQLSGFKRELETDVVSANAAGDAARAKDSAAALNVLHALQRQHYHPETDLPAVPNPGAPPAEDDEDEDAPGTPAGPPLASGLPRLLKILDRVNGKPLTRAQQESLIKSFPMGDIVWRLGAQDLWRQGLTGQHVKVAVIDGGIGKHGELEGAVKARTNFTAQRGKALADDHGTHVAGILHAIAPDAEIRGYTVLTEDNSNPALMETADTPLLEAVDQAVRDGNLIINMSLGTAGGPSDSLARKVEQYSQKGVLFIVSAGNERGSNDISAPSVAPNALTAGALDGAGAGRPADFSSYGANFDARKLKYVVKSVFMLPGVNIYSTIIGPDGESGYALMNGTSMAAPALSGVAALLAQAAAAMTPNPLELSSRVRDALVESSSPLSLDKLPPNAPFDQPFLVVRPSASLDALRRKTPPAAVGGPGRN